MNRKLRTEADMVGTLDAGTYTISDLYSRAERAGLADRPGGRRVIQDGQEQYKRRVRSALQGLKRQGRARRVTDGGAAAWLIEGTPDRPRKALFVWLPAAPGEAELVLGKATEVLGQADEPIDLIVADPPWALGRGKQGSGYRRTYGRDHGQVIGGYVEVEAEAYADFTAEWVAAAGKALRPGGYLAVVTGPEQAARVQVAAEDVAGLTYVNRVASGRRFGLYTTRRFVHQHYVITLMTRGALESPLRVFHRPEEMPRGRNGEIYAVDWWDDIPEERRNGLLRYDNALSTRLVSRVIRSTTNPGDLVADPFLGSGTTAVACLQDGRRFYGGDANKDSLRFTMARILAEVLPTLPHGQAPAAARVYTQPDQFDGSPWAVLLKGIGSCTRT